MEAAALDCQHGLQSATEAQEAQEEAAAESQALPVGDKCGPPRGCGGAFACTVHLALVGRRQPLFEGNLSTGRERANDKLRDAACGPTGFRSGIFEHEPRPTAEAGVWLGRLRKIKNFGSEALEESPQEAEGKGGDCRVFFSFR